MSSWNCLTISGPITLIGGLSIVTRQYAGDRWATRICGDVAGTVICVTLVGAFAVAMEFSSVFECSLIQPEQDGLRNWTIVLGWPRRSRYSCSRVCLVQASAKAEISVGALDL